MGSEKMDQSQLHALLGQLVVSLKAERLENLLLEPLPNLLSASSASFAVFSIVLADASSLHPASLLQISTRSLAVFLSASLSNQSS